MSFKKKLLKLLMAIALLSFKAHLVSPARNFMHAPMHLRLTNHYLRIIGTGKTVTGAHLAYVLANKLRKEQPSSKASQLSVAGGSVNVEELRPCVMYCGPSNQAVNVVLSKCMRCMQLSIIFITVLFL